MMAKFHERRGEEGEANGRRMSERLIACGPSAIAPIIKAIREGGTWNRTYAYLPSALEGLGEPAHQAMLAAIDSEQDAQARAYLISALHWSFSDFSRFDRWLADASNGLASTFQMTHFEADVRHKYPEAPALIIDGRLNTKFMEWWQTNSQSQP